MSILEVTNLTHSFGEKKVFNNISLELFRGDKMGLTGLNGAGKSTLINIMTGQIIPDDGMVRWNPKSTYGYLDQQARIDQEQTVREYLRGAFADLFEADRKLKAIALQTSECKDDDEMAKLLEQAGEYQSRLEAGGFYSVESEIEKVSAGLGIIAFGLDTPVSKLSGGQRAKIMLAKLLLQNPDVLLLDEPTNFLDREHIEWLGKFLCSFKGSFILVSHDFNFLNRVVNCVCDIEYYSVTRYNGTYESFVKQKAEKGEEYVRQYNHQQKEIAKLEDYISRNLYRASTTAMAQSRRKKLEKIDRLDKPMEAPKPVFSFQYRSVAPKALLRVHDLEVGYDQPLLPKINLTIKTGEKVCVSGFNGIGKTTFLRTVSGLLPKLSGNIHLERDVVIGYFEQENRWDDPSRTAFAQVKEAYPTMKDKEVRSHLARCGLRADQVMQSLSTLSGGEQAKVKLCLLVLKPCNLLILDEPTNHLDVNAIERLREAIKAFEGAVLFVSHSKPFCDALADKRLDMEALFD